MITSGSERKERDVLLHMFVLVVLNLPLSWKKVHGGVEAECIGYWLDMTRFELGISASRAGWAVRWLSDKATEGRVKLGELREGLGRLSRSKLPIMVVLILKYLAGELASFRTMPCQKRANFLGEVFRLDAKAEGDTVAVGGWRSAGGAKAAEAKWFSVSLTRATAPWAFARGEPFRAIAALELLASLIGLMVLVPECEAAGETSAILTLSCGTDNQGNSYLLDRMLTTKYPLGVVLMELAHQMRLRRLILRAKWLPRLQNEEADALTNLDFRHFRAENRIPVDLETIKFGVLNELFAAGETYVADLEEARGRAKAAAEALKKKEAAEGGVKKRRRKVAGDSIRERQPW